MSAISNLINTVVSLINGLIVGLFSFILGVLDGLDDIDSLVEHAVSSITNFFTAILTLGNDLFPFIPAEWMAMIETMLLVLAIGTIIRKKVIG